jgi:hypothetical protein
MPVRRTWHGDEIEARSKRANGRAILGMGAGVVDAMQRNTHEVSGLLKRTEHMAKPSTLGLIEANSETVISGRNTWEVEAGSWLPYACVENNRGGTHRFADIGWEQARQDFDVKLERAWREEGL